ncbi:acyl transferase domain-containing protein [Labedaea rhizosphaerae]|uniref:6-deoxyerythronolide-B synthase n=1 Tax=Labedaea rhizosphaerae TaxID=598644 RepID=A0A4R6SJZ6_LABRH|nr:type I polyketide synthase [Labedaea rhizosphaerae]TDQ04389.1 acyl transferase domain-containing protein [Labedaea rhizosphaerae]
MGNPDEKLVAALRAALKESDRLRTTNRKLAAAAREPIAIVAMSCRYPGGVGSPEDLWRLVADGVDAVSSFPVNRGWDTAAVFDPTGERPGTSYTDQGGFLHTAGEFDPAFFGISPNEALIMDPQQRLLLEASWEAFERAGIDPAGLKGSNTGVFAGMMYHDYVHNNATGSIASGRVSYVFGFEGPSITVDTACSSSLVTLHLAAQALRSGECSLALAGGVAVMSTPEVFVEFSRQRGLARDGRCKSFSGSTDGTGWSEGVGMLLLEKLSDAKRNGHPILAVVRGSAINQDGASNGLTAPNGPSQRRVIKAALANAGLSSADIDLIEAHGTGTTLGDPIEAQALLSTYGQERPADRPVWLGSLKSNIGHSQAAAGVGGIIKVVQAIRNGVLPKTLHVTEPTPQVDWTEGAVELLTESRPWPSTEGPRRGAVSSFGLSGTNAHVIIEQAPAIEDEPVEVTATLPRIPWLLSAKTPEALSAQASRLLDAPGDALDIAYSLATTRVPFEHRACVVGSQKEELLTGLTGFTKNAVRKGKTAFLFTGQGAQRIGMARDLHAAYPVFAAAFDAALAELDQHLDRPLRAVIWGEDAELLSQTQYTQTSLFAIEVALYRLVESWGVKPDFLAGHSIGEIAAAHVAGVLSLADAAKLVAARGRLMQALPSGGAMIAIQATEDEVRPHLTERVDIAAVNGPRSVVISGDAEAAQAVADQFADRKSTRLKVSHAFHSVLMEPMLDDFRAVAAGLTYNQPSIPIVSGELADVTTPVYWVNHVRDAVRFADSVSFLEAQGVSKFLELGPDAILAGMAQEIVPERPVIPVLRRNRDEATTALAALGQLWAAGYPVDWAEFFAGTGAKKIDLPTYAFQHELYWLTDEREGGDASTFGLTAADHPLLGATLSLADPDTTVLTGRLSLGTHGWIADHDVLGSVLVPGTGFVEMAIRAGDQVGCDVVDELTLQAPLVLPEHGAVAVQVVVGSVDNTGRRPIGIFSRAEGSDDPWLQHAQGLLATGAAPPAVLTAWPPPGATAIDVEGAYALLVERGYGYGPVFQGLKAAWTSGEEIFAEVALPESAHGDAAKFGLHPALLDAAMHVALIDDGSGTSESTVLPFAWTGVALHAAGASALRVRIAPNGQDNVTVAVADTTGSPVLTIGALVSRPVSAEQLAQRDESLWGVAWQPIPTPEPVAAPNFYEVPSTEGDVLAAVRATTHQVLDVLQQEHDGPLVILTRGAVGDEPELAQAPVWGLVRAAQAENPGRFVLADTDDSIDTADAVALAAGAGEPEVRVRDGKLEVPRLTKVAIPDESTDFGDGTVLVTGGTGGLGGVVAKHLVAARGVRKLVLTSRRGLAAPGAAELAEELTTLGAEVTVAACDAADRASLEAVLDGIDDLTGIVHAAGVGDNGVISALTPERIDAVLGPKADAAWHLHELTRDRDLRVFAMFSSAGGMVLAAGQGNYAAANVFLDALATHRRANGLPATALAYGLWTGAGMGQYLADADLARMKRQGLPALTVEDGLALFDAGIDSGQGAVAALHIDPAALAGRSDEIPALLRGLVRPARRKAARAGAADVSELSRKLAGKEPHERAKILLELVRNQVAATLGHSTADAIEPDRAFSELGFDSLSAVELRNELNNLTGLRLPATLVFDYPTARSVASYVDEQFTGSDDDVRQTVAVQADADDPIVIVSMACRYPGGVTSPEDLWQLVVDGRDVIGEFPNDRGWNVGSVYDPEPGKPGKTYANEGGFLYDAGDFDADLFGVAPNEALYLDPQQRLLLEASWEVFERAGIDPTSLKGTRTGVFAGLMYHDYAQGTDAAATSGGSLVSGRVSYTLGLEGPSVTVDTACSSSLVALHLAAQAVRSGECPMALAGGVAVMGSPDMFIEFSRQRGLAPDGRCKSFAGTADGAAWSEGVGVLLVERLSDARRNGHPVLAVLKGIAVNQDGASNGMTAPNGPSQRRVIQQALANAGLSYADVDLLEAHGTGTKLGDPIEAQALLATYGQDRPEGRPLWLGSIKSNMGHPQAAAGVAGIIKVVHAIRAGVLPKTLHIDEPTPHVDWTEGDVELLTEAREWPEKNGPRRAGVSSFGLSGTNVHVIIEAAPEEKTKTVEVVPPPVVPVVVTGKSAAAVQAQAARLASHVDDASVLDLGYSSLTSRAVLDHRAVVVAADREGLLTGLTGISAGNGVHGHARASGSTAFLFTGQGAQRIGMGRELHAAYPAFATAFDEAIAELDKHLDRPLRDVVWGDDAELLAQTQYTQTSLFAIEVALYRLVESWGVKPDYLAGHSIGEIAAAHVAGVLSLADAAKLVAARGRLMQALPSGGAMIAIQATEEEVRPHLTDRVDIAAVNGPQAVVVSGDADAAQAVADRFPDRKSTRLKVSHAFHSVLMEPMLDEFRAIVSELTYALPEIPIVSGELADVTTPVYWVNHVRDAVRFADSVRFLESQGVTRFLELGPDAILAGMAQQSTETALIVPILRRNRDEATTAVTAIGQLWTSGVHVAWDKYFAGTGAKRVDLPTYAFQHQRFWVVGDQSGGDPTSFGLAVADHPLLGAAVPLAGSDGLVLSGRLSLDTHGWIADHDILGSVLLPGTGFVELAIQAGDQVGCDVIEELTLQAPLVMPEGAPVSVQVVIGDPDETGRRTIGIYSRTGDDPWLQHADGLLGTGAGGAAADLTQWPPAGAETADVSDVYDVLLGRGYGYGPVFQGLKKAWTVGDDIYAEIELPEEAHGDAARYGIHPALLDASMHALSVSGGGEDGKPALPFSWGGVRLHAVGAKALRVRLTWPDDNAVAIHVADASGAPVLSVDALTLRAISAEQLGGSADDDLLAVEWKPVTTAAGLPSWTAWGEGTDEHVVFDCVTAGAGVLADVRTLTHQVLDVVQRFLADDAHAGSTLVVVTHGGVSVAGEDVDPVQVPVWGLLRSAQAENPGRFVLADVDGFPEAIAVAIASGEPEVAVRDGIAHAPRLAPVPAVEDTLVWDPDGAVLITGGTGGLGAVIARHLVADRGVRHLVLTSRRGLDADGAPELAEELTGLGATVSIVACDVSDRDAVAALLASIEQPLFGVVHAAGVGDNGLITALTPERIDAVLGPKADAAWHLHELAGDVRVFAMFASAGGMVLAAGQGNYAAANTFLEGLALHRAAQGRPATSLAYGLWTGAGLGQYLGDADLQRMRRQGLPALEPAEGVALFDAGVGSGRAALVPLKVDKAALRARTDEIPALLRGLAPAVRRRSVVAAVDAESLWQKLSGASEAEQEQALRTLVLEQAATLLGHADATAVDPERDFLESGFDSLSAMELRNGLMAATGLRLPPMVVFDNKNPAELARVLRAELASNRPRSAPAEDKSAETLRALFHGAITSGKVSQGFELLRAVAAIRPAFESADDLEALPRGVNLADGPASPRLICLATPMATGGVHQHARLVSHLQGTRKIVGLPVPGFLNGELLPASPEAALKVLAASVLEAAEGEPFVLLGYSSGGTLAYSTAGYLEQSLGVRAAGVVLLDTFQVHDGGGEGVPMDDLAMGLFEKEAAFGTFDTARLSGMGRWVELVPALPSPKVAAPVLFVQCTQSFAGGSIVDLPPAARAAAWEPEHTTREVRANHFTIVEDDAEKTAQLIDEWLRTDTHEGS